MNGMVSILKKEIREILRDPYTLLVAILLPLVLLFLFGYALNLDLKDIPVAVVDLDNSPESRGYVDALINTRKFELKYRLNNPEEAGLLLDQGKAKLILLIPTGFAKDLSAGRTAEVQTLVDGTFPTSAKVVQGYLEGVTESYNARLLSKHFDAMGISSGEMLTPAVVAIPRVRYNPAFRSVNFIVPGLFGVILMAFPPMLSALAIVREKERGSIQQIFISPVRPLAFIVGKLIPYAVIAYCEMILILLAARYWFGVPIAGNVWLFALASVPYVFSTVAIGLLVSTLTRSQLAAMLMAIVLTMMPAFLFGGFMWPIFTMPKIFQSYSYLFPARYYTQIIRGVFLRGAGLDAWMDQLVMLAAYATVLVALSALLFKKKVG